MLEAASAETADQGNTVRLLCDPYAQHPRRNEKEASLRIFLDTCPSGIEQFGDKAIADFKPLHVTEWLEEMAKIRRGSQGRTGKWGETYPVMALRALICGLN